MKRRQTLWLNNFDLACKRIFDFTVSGIALIILSPVLLILSCLVRLLDGAPIFFVQDRPGKGGRNFRIFKFRTMKHTVGSIELRDEERITKIGQFLRSTSLDELPELWNVFKGDMSFVGPRPLLTKYLARYTPEQLRRHEIRPGITGLAQINGRNQQTWEQRLRDDVWYIDNRNFLIDLKILFQTLYQVFLRKGISAEGYATMPEFKPTSWIESKQSIEMSSADINEQDVAAVVKVLRSGRLALGPQVNEFEKNMAEYVGVKHAIAVSSGTAGLHLLIKSFGIGPGDEVLVPSFTFAASVNAILYEGATPVFVDICPDTYNLSTDDLEKKRTARTKAILVVDVFGHPADWDEINSFAEKYNLIVIDDCCEALGASYKGKKLGSFGHGGVFAFYPNKQITTGEGGMIVTNNDEVAKLCRSYRNQGRDEMGQWLEHVRLGYNYRMDEMSGALGVTQLARLEEFLEKRDQVAKCYNKKLESISEIRIPQVKSNVRMSWFVYVITLEHGIDANHVINELQKRGIPTRAYFSPIHRQAYVQNLKMGTTALLPNTESVKNRTLALPFHNNMSEEQIDFIVRNLCEVIENKQRQFTKMKETVY